MPAIPDRAIVLRLSDYSETSQIASLFTRDHGLVRLIAKGMRRGTRTRVNVGLDLLECGELSFLPSKSAATLAILTEWRQTALFPGLRTDLARLYAALYAAELTLKLNEEYDPHPDLFDALGEHLIALEHGKDVEPAVVRFQFSLLTATGYAPTLGHCVTCGGDIRGNSAYFSSRAGGVICRDCEVHQIEKRRIDPARIVASAQPSDPPSSQQAASLRALLDYHITQIAGARPAMSESLEFALRHRTR